MLTILAPLERAIRSGEGATKAAFASFIVPIYSIYFMSHTSVVRSIRIASVSVKTVAKPKRQSDAACCADHITAQRSNDRHIDTQPISAQHSSFRRLRTRLA